jgi:hypothetical protein
VKLRGGPPPTGPGGEDPAAPPSGPTAAPVARPASRWAAEDPVPGPQVRRPVRREAASSTAGTAALGPSVGEGAGPLPGQPGSQRPAAPASQAGHRHAVTTGAGHRPIAPPPAGSPPGSASDAAFQQALDKLARFDFPPGLTPDERLAQEALQARYARWLADKVIAPRQALFGPGAYEPGEDMAALGSQTALPAAYQSVRQFISSATRSPTRNAVVTALAPRYGEGSIANGELFQNQYDPAVIGGVAGGLAAYAAEATLTAMDSRARLANMPSLVAVDVNRLVPDPPDVVLRIEDGHKRYARTGLPGAPSHAELRDEVQAQRDSLAKWQAILSGEGMNALHQPLFSGALNALRRAVSDDQALLDPVKVFTGSVWASGLAGAAARGSLDLMKGLPWLSQARLDDHAGGQQTLNLFTLEQRHPDAPGPSVSRLPRLALDSACEAAAMLTHAVNPRGRPIRDVLVQWSDMLARFGVANTFASVSSPGTGALLASVKRGPAGPQPDESLRSGAYLLQQFGQSGTSDFVWQASRAAFGKSTHSLASSLDRKRKRESAELALQATTATEGLRACARGLLHQVDGESGRHGRVAAVLESLTSLGPDVDRAQLKTARRTVAAWTDNDPIPRRDRLALLAALRDVIEPLDRRAAIDAWRHPAPTA